MNSLRTARLVLHGSLLGLRREAFLDDPKVLEVGEFYSRIPKICLQADSSPDMDSSICCKEARTFCILE